MQLPYRWLYADSNENLQRAFFCILVLNSLTYRENFIEKI